MKCTGRVVRSSDNHLQWTYWAGDSHLHVFITTFFFLLSWLAPVFLWTKQERRELPTTAWWLQILVKKRTEQKTERRDGAPLLSRGLRLPIILSTCWQVGCHSVCLATQLPSTTPLQHPITFHHTLLQFTTCYVEELTASSGKQRRQKKRRVWLQESDFDSGNISERYKLRELFYCSFGVVWVFKGHCHSCGCWYFVKMKFVNDQSVLTEEWLCNVQIYMCIPSLLRLLYCYFSPSIVIQTCSCSYARFLTMPLSSWVSFLKNCGEV